MADIEHNWFAARRKPVAGWGSARVKSQDWSPDKEALHAIVCKSGAVMAC